MHWLARQRAASRSDAGVTLIETLVALSILAVAGVAIMAGLQLTVKASDIHRKQSTGGSAVRGWAEAIEKYLDSDGHYVPCAGPNAYQPATVGFVLPDDEHYTATATAAEPLDGSGAKITSGSCPTRDKGVQRLTLTIASLDGRAAEHLTIVVRRSCGTGTSCQ